MGPAASFAYERPDFPDAMALFSRQRYHYFDVRGIVRVFDLALEDDGWSMINVSDDGLSQRATARFPHDDAIDVTGQRSTDTGLTWEPDFTMTLTRDPVTTASAATLSARDGGRSGCPLAEAGGWSGVGRTGRIYG